MKTFSVNDILWAFIENADGAHRPIQVSMAGTPWGYVRIKGPTGKHQIVIEHSTLPGVRARPAQAGNPTISSKRITEHPLGHSSGSKIGGLLWGISAQDLVNNYASPAAFVDAIVRACAAAGSP